MAVDHKDAIGDQTSTTGTSDYVIDGVPLVGCVAFSSNLTDGNTYSYRCQDSTNSNWEVGQGVWTASTHAMTRATVFQSSNFGSKVNWASGSKSIAIVTAAYDLNNSLRTDTSSTVAVGYLVTPYNAGTKSSGTFTPNPANGNYQYFTNGGAFTLAAPASDCGISLQMTNNGTAGAVTFSGFTVGSVTGDALDTTNTHVFRIRIERINGIASYSIQALQ